MKNPLSYSTNSLNLGKWHPVHGVSNGNNSANSANDFSTLFLVPGFGKVKNFRVKIDVAGGATNGEIFTVYKNGVATNVTCTLNGTTEGSDTKHSFDVSPGDYINFYYDASSDGNPGQGAVCLEIE